MGREEDEEWRRLEEERRKLSPEERLHGAPMRMTGSGFIDGRSRRRTGRKLSLPLRVHPRIYALIDAIMDRDGHVSRVQLLEVMVETYLQVHGEIPEDQLPSDEDLIARIERERDKRDGE